MKNTTNDLAAFKNRIFLHGLSIALIFEGGSLLFLGLDAGFAYGLALGTAVSIVNFNILARVSRRLLDGGRPWMSFVGYIARLAVYGFAFYMALRVSHIAAIGAALGFLTLKLAIYYVHGFRAPRAQASAKRKFAPPPQRKPRKKGLMKEIFGSSYDEDEDEREDEDGESKDE
ncbi:MAG: ATP synthase subunit I [Clostridiales Family XIII bacterium]|jgi:small basic protein|nr:ATP synthase subunit I [Clostridiales Family XIII bacterium]